MSEEKSVLSTTLIELQIEQLSKKEWVQICDPMNEFLDQYRDSEYIGCIGMEMASRPNSIGAGTAVETGQANRKPEMIKEANGRFCEPIWIWEKK